MGTEYPKCVYLKNGQWKTVRSKEEEIDYLRVDNPPPIVKKVFSPAPKSIPKIKACDVVENKTNNRPKACLERYEAKMMFTDIQSGNKLVSPDLSV
jgi:hypothetical protein